MKWFRGRRAPTIGVFGGAFDPPHIAHALLPGYVLAQGLADHVIVAPVADHPLGKSLRPFADRLAMTRAAMMPYGERVEVSDIEAVLAAAGGPSVSLRLLDAIAAEHPGARVRIVIGSDIVATGETARWHRWDEIEARYDPIVVPRVGFAEADAGALPRVESRAIRAWLAAGQLDRVAQVVPAAVLPWLVPPPSRTVWIVGRGHVATHAAPWLRARGMRPVMMSGRAVADGSAPWPDTDPPAAIWVLVNDPAIEAVARAIAAAPIDRGIVVLHGAGAHRSADVLAVAAASGHPVGTLHPICALRRERPWPSPLPTATFGIEGDPAARAIAQTLVGDQPWLDLQPLAASDRRAYHGACALVANHLAVLWDTGGAVLHDHGLDPQAVSIALARLLISALDNLVALEIPAGVTGPAARNDFAAVAAHVAALPDDAARLYADLSQRLTRILTR